MEEVDAPVPADNELLVRVVAATVNRTDMHRRAASPFVWRLILGIRKPKRRVLGTEFAGLVEQVGSGVAKYKVGDEVFGRKWFGAHAELLTIAVDKIVARKPSDVSFEQAAASTDGAFSALGCLRGAGVAAGMHVLVYGGSGAIGSAAVQLAKQMGARVTAVARTKNVELMRTLGADDVLDYTAGQDFMKNVGAYDVVIDAAGKLNYWKVRRSLRPGGRYVSTESLSNLWIRLFTRRAAWPDMRQRPDDVQLIRRLLESGEFRPVVDRTYRLEEIVDAYRYVDSKQKTGNVILRPASG